MYIETEGIVLRSMKYGEADMILTVLTKKLGKIRLFSKSSKRMKSPVMSATQNFARSVFSLFPSKEAYSLHSAELLDNYYRISADLSKFAYSSYFLEMADKMLADNQPNSAYFDLVGQMLDLTVRRRDYDFLRLVYELKSLQFSGLKPEVSKCANCGMIEVERYRYFSFDEGGVICGVCRKNLPAAAVLDPSSVRFMAYAFRYPLSEVVNAKVSDILIKELVLILGQYREYHLGKFKLHSMELMDMFKEEKA